MNISFAKLGHEECEAFNLHNPRHTKLHSCEIAAETITIKYFEAGHTFMSADSFHHLVEKELKRNPKCYDFQDFVNVVNNSTSSHCC